MRFWYYVIMFLSICYQFHEEITFCTTLKCKIDIDKRFLGIKLSSPTPFVKIVPIRLWSIFYVGDVLLYFCALLHNFVLFISFFLYSPFSLSNSTHILKNWLLKCTQACPLQTLLFFWNDSVIAFSELHIVYKIYLFADVFVLGESIVRAEQYSLLYQKGLCVILQIIS